MPNTNPEFDKFDAVMKKVLSVSHDELKRRAARWKKERQRANKKRAKASATKAVG
jgi:hypothetical protein